jgi:hypothetical protein
VAAGLFCCRRYQYGRFFVLNIYTLPFAVQPHGYYTRDSAALNLARAAVAAGWFCCRRYQYGRFFVLNIYTLPFAVQPHGYYTRDSAALNLARAITLRSMWQSTDSERETRI